MSKMILSRDNPELFAEYNSLFQTASADMAKVCDVGKKLRLSGFDAESDTCFQFCMKAMRHFAAAGNADLCLKLESMMHPALVATTETEKNHYDFFKHWVTLFRELGKKQQQPFTTETDKRKICFVMVNGHRLGHTEVMMKTVATWRALNIDADVYCAIVGVSDPGFTDQLARLNIHNIELTRTLPLDFVRALSETRDQLRALKIHTAVWLSIPQMASYALAMKLAPRQVFWSMKFHAVFVPEADLHVCDGHDTEDFRYYNDNKWTVSPFPLTVAFSENPPEDLAAFRSKFPKDALLLGSLAREEKIDAPEFLSTVCQILKRNPQAHYLWTGKEQPPRVLSAFQDAGVADRCHFIGWVNTNLVAEALDMFLDTFPFGCGVTGFHAMGHGTPLVSKFGSDTLFGIRLSGSKPARALGRRPSREATEALDILTAVDAQHYADLAQRLIDDAAFRGQIIERERAYYRAEEEALPRYAGRLWKNLSGSAA